MTIRDRLTHAMIPLERAVLCASCNTVSDSTGDTCIACDGVGGLLNLATVLNRTVIAETTAAQDAAVGAQ